MQFKATGYLLLIDYHIDLYMYSSKFSWAQLSAKMA